jgi:hypothetical protein
MKLCILLLSLSLALALEIRPDFQPFTAQFDGQLLQDFIHMDVQDPVTEQRVAGPLTWLQLLPGLTPRGNDSLVIAPKILAQDKFGWQFRYHSFVLGYRLFGASGANNATTQFFRFRVQAPPAEDLTAIYACMGVYLGLVAIVLVVILVLGVQN